MRLIVTYKGAKAQIAIKVIIVTGTNAFKNASFIMQKIINAIACITFVLTLGSIGSAYFGYKYITSPKGQEKIKNKLWKN